MQKSNFRKRKPTADANANIIALDATETKDLEALTLDQQALAILDGKLARVRDLKRRNLASEQDLDTAKQAVVNQKLQINRRELALATIEVKRTQLRTTIQRFEASSGSKSRPKVDGCPKAPADGQVVEVNVVAGDRVQSTQNLVVFAPDSGREVRVQVPATVGQTLTQALANSLPVSASTDRGNPLTLTRVNGSVDEYTESIDAFSHQPIRYRPQERSSPCRFNLSQSQMSFNVTGRCTLRR